MLFVKTPIIDSNKIHGNDCDVISVRSSSLEAIESLFCVIFDCLTRSYLSNLDMERMT